MAEQAKGTVVTEVAEPCQQYLSFMLNGEEYALDILCVQELRGWCRATAVPGSPAFMCGVINLRGEIIPVIDLRCRFGLPVVEPSHETVVIVLRVAPAGRILGVVVDAMAETCELVSNEIVTPPAQIEGIPAEYVQGLATLDERMLVVLDAPALLAMAELTGQGGIEDEC
ncbi:MAG: chemotaxis protein CheW [Marinobacterium sp.]|nr:chemotaxis protein CheW [Marinobacterium sp.]